jgi:hypothetical protein
MANFRQIVDPPSFTPLPFGLWSVVETPTENDVHWQQGINYQPLCSASVTGIGATSYSDCIVVTGGGAPPPAPPITNNMTQTVRGATPFETYAEFDCAVVGLIDAQGTAERALSMAEPWQVERAFWTGLAGGPNGTNTTVFPHLAANSQVLDQTSILLQTAAVNVTGAGSIGVAGDLLNVETALGLLEGALANCYDGVGVIHVPQFLLPTMDAWGIVKQQGAVMKTLNGNKVAVGAGYPGTGPDGSTRLGNSCWMYATGNVFGFRTNVRVRSPESSPASFDRSNNTRRMIAERTYVLGWDCCHFAVQTALGVPRGT